MTEISRPWGGITIGDSGPYSNEQWQAIFRTFFGPGANEGVFPDRLNELLTTGATSPISVTTGEALVHGTWYQSDAAQAAIIATPSVSTRIDRAVLRKTWATQQVRLALLTGVEGGGAPALTQTDSVIWEIPLVQISITTGGAITLTDERHFLASVAIRVGTLAQRPTEPTEDGRLIYYSTDTDEAFYGLGGSWVQIIWAHGDLTGVTSDQHHTEAHTIVSHSDTTATGAELETLTDGSNADALHAHVSPAHTVASHSDTTATGAELETLTDGSDAGALHTHTGLAPGPHTIASHSDTTGTGAELNTLTDGSNADALHAHVSPSHTVASHSDTTATGAELETLTDGSNADALHAHVSPSHTVASHSDTTGTGAELNTLTGGSGSDAQTLHDHADKSETTHTHTSAQIVTGTYTGDGTLSQVVTATGVDLSTHGIVFIFRRKTSPSIAADREAILSASNIVDDDAVNGMAVNLDNGSGAVFWNTVAIVAMANASFTVNDAGTDNHPNQDTVVYNFIAIGR